MLLSLHSGQDGLELWDIHGQRQIESGIVGNAHQGLLFEAPHSPPLAKTAWLASTSTMAGMKWLPVCNLIEPICFACLISVPQHRSKMPLLQRPANLTVM